MASGPRSDCGFVGINATSCAAKGCCWDPESNSPWCFYPTPPTPVCNAAGTRNDCGFEGINQLQCQNKGCCWSPSQNGQPWCFQSNQPVMGYGVQQAVNTDTGLVLTLALLSGSAIYGPDVPTLKVAITFETADRVRVKITDANHQRWEVPEHIIPDTTSQKPNKRNYAVSYTSFPFGFAITRTTDNVVIFNTTSNGLFNNLIFENQYLELSTSLPANPNIYGIGEHVRRLKLDADGSSYTLWNRDDPTPINQNEYGAHPFYMEMRQGKAHGVFLKNSNGMDVIVGPTFLTYKTIGGVFDFYFFMGPAPEVVVKQYQEVIGTPHMPPFWSLGFHHCKYGFKNLDEVKSVVKGYKDHKIPLDTIWTDIDYMDAFKDFTFDPVNFPQPDMAAYVQELHSQGQKYVVIIDPAIHDEPGYDAYEQGLKQDVFVKTSGGDVFIGKVWPGTTAFPAFINPGTWNYWRDQIDAFLQTVPFDGLWIDMNEPASFCNGACVSEPRTTLTTRNGYAFDAVNPPYAINNCGWQCPLNTKTIDADAVHYNDVIEYDAHNLYGIAESIATKNAMQSLRNERTLVISRSTYPGAGRHVGHWLGDNFATFESLRYSVSGMLAMNIYGIPLVGSDICGFIDETTEELCGRWIQMGAFHPFSRNHHTINEASQELYKWPSVANISRVVLGARYRLLPYMNTLFFEANQHGGTVIRPLFFEFPNDPILDNDEQFLVGPGLLISPVLDANVSTVEAYFSPASTWYDFWSYAPLTRSGWLTLAAPFQHLNIHIRGGTIIPTQTPELTTAAMAKNPYQLLVPLDARGTASGSLYLDDGLTLDVGGKSSTVIQYLCSGRVLKAVIQQDGYAAAKSLRLSEIAILGVPSAPSSVVFNGAPVASNLVNYNANTKALLINTSSLSIAMNAAFALTF